MRIVTPETLAVQVRIANEHPVSPGQTWERSIIDLQFIAPLRGRFAYRDANTTVDVEPGQVLCIEPGIAHAFALAPGTKAGHMAGVHLECAPGRWLDGDYRLDPAPQCLTAVAAAEIDLIQHCAVIYAGDHRYRQTLCNTLATTLLVLLAARWTGITPGTSAPERLQDMLAYLRQHAVRGCTRNDLAQAFACTPEHINWLFRQHLGTTPGLAVQRERCRIAYDLLHQHAASVTIAATAAGYADPFHFSRVFRRIYGVAPSQVR